MGVTACHTPFHTCFNRCKEPRRWEMCIRDRRVGTILDADRIIVLDEGKVAGIGTHLSLIHI